MECIAEIIPTEIIDTNAELGPLASRDYKNERKLTGKITRLFCEREAFCAGRIRTDHGPMLARDCLFKINDHVSLNDELTFIGKWGWVTLRGERLRQFEVASVQYPSPDIASTSGLAEYIQNMDGADGIGPIKASRIAAAFPPEEFDDIIRNNPERIAEVAKVRLDQVLSLQRAWCERADVNAISVWLAGYGITPGQIRKIAQAYGNRAEVVLRTNPYELHKIIEGIGFLRNDEIALKMGVEKNDRNRLRAGILFLINKEHDESGNCYIPRAELISNVVKNLYLDALDARAQVDREIDALCAPHGQDQQASLVSHEVSGAAYIGARWLHEMETALLDMLTDVSLRRPSAIPMETTTDELTDEQNAALSNALAFPVSIITGGAGTGKSHTIRSIKDAVIAAEQTVSVCTPTGKAARRLQADGIMATTIHRLLEYSPVTGNFTRNAENPLDADAVIVDEVSMCAIPLLHSLASAIDFSRTRLVLVGDYNQLPPIGPGNTLRDFVDNELVPVTRLTKCHRNAGRLKENCAGILTGRVSRDSEFVPAEISEQLAERWAPAWFVIQDGEEPQTIIDRLCNLQSSQFAAWGFDPLMDCQIITPQNPGPLGVNRLNLELQRIEQAKRGVSLPPITDPKARPKLLVGDKVMQTKNDYGHGLMNGTQGVILRIDREEDPENPLNMLDYYVIQFDDRDEELRLRVGEDESKNLVPAYAVTVHKVQGSQYPCVVSVVHRTHSYMLSRNLLYTAVTRARFASIILGESRGIARAAQAVGNMERRTWTALRVAR